MRISDWSSDVCSSDLSVLQARALGSFTFKSSRIGSPIPISVIHLSLDQPTLHSRVQFPPESKGQERPGRVHVQSVRPDCGGARFVKAAGGRSQAWSGAARVSSEGGGEGKGCVGRCGSGGG